ncbi:UNVERIFIED_CONTAM: hypothetical protein FKN15_050009 [Acipenser sinensis]
MVYDIEADEIPDPGCPAMVSDIEADEIPDPGCPAMVSDIEADEIPYPGCPAMVSDIEADGIPDPGCTAMVYDIEADEIPDPGCPAMVSDIEADEIPDPGCPAMVYDIEADEIPDPGCPAMVYDIKADGIPDPGCPAMVYDIEADGIPDPGCPAMTFTSEFLFDTSLCVIIKSETSCGGHLNAKDAGYITSPGYPHEYPPHQRCEWVITAPEPTQKIVLNFNPHFELEKLDCRVGIVTDLTLSSLHLSTLSSENGNDMKQKNPWHRKLTVIIAFLFVVGIIALVTTAVVQNKPLPKNNKYGIVLDAGSSHTSLYIYEWPAEKQNDTGVVQQLHVCHVKGPGISSYAMDPEGAGRSLQDCMDEAKRIVPERRHKETLGATAGMRLLKLQNPEGSEKVLSSVEKTLSSSPFEFQGARIITGQDEGAYGWITVNYLMGNFKQGSGWLNLWPKPETTETLGALDLGGASTQITFVPEGEIESLESSLYFQLYGNKYSVYTHSFLCYGKDQALKITLAKQLQLKENFPNVKEKYLGEYCFSGTYILTLLETGYKFSPENWNTIRFIKKVESETLAVIRWMKNYNFVLSANLHGGAVVANYPFDKSREARVRGYRKTSYSATADDKIFKKLARTYSYAHGWMHQGWNCGDYFDEGITNGASWYSLAKGMQDFNYLHTNCFEITLELSCNKFPAAQELQREWLGNREALVSYLEQVHLGIKGMVYDENNNGIKNAVISIYGINHDITTGVDGDYFRLLLPGTYTVTASAEGYQPSTSTVTVGPAEAIQLHFYLKAASQETTSETQSAGNNKKVPPHKMAPR